MFTLLEVTRCNFSVTENYFNGDYASFQLTVLNLDTTDSVLKEEAMTVSFLYAQNKDGGAFV